MRDIRCNGCGRLLGYTSRPQAVPAQCTDPFCAATPPVGANEERDSFIEHLNVAAERPPEAIGQVFGLTRQRVQQVLTARACV